MFEAVSWVELRAVDVVILWLWLRWVLEWVKCWLNRLKMWGVFVIAIGFYGVLRLRLRLIDCLSVGRTLKQICLWEVIESVGFRFLSDLWWFRRGRNRFDLNFACVYVVVSVWYSWLSIDIALLRCLLHHNKTRLRFILHNFRLDGLFDRVVHSWRFEVDLGLGC